MGVTVGGGKARLSARLGTELRADWTRRSVGTGWRAITILRDRWSRLDCTYTKVEYPVPPPHAGTETAADIAVVLVAVVAVAVAVAAVPVGPQVAPSAARPPPRSLVPARCKCPHLLPPLHRESLPSLPASRQCLALAARPGRRKIPPWLRQAQAPVHHRRTHPCDAAQGEEGAQLPPPGHLG